MEERNAISTHTQDKQTNMQNNTKKQTKTTGIVTLFNVISSKMLRHYYLKCEKCKERKMSFNTGTLSINIVLLRTSV